MCANTAKETAASIKAQMSPNLMMETAGSYEMLIHQHKHAYSFISEHRPNHRWPTYTHTYIYIYTGCPRSNVPDFGRVFLMLRYTDITQNTYIQS